jgi:hypothetical protein
MLGAGNRPRAQPPWTLRQAHRTSPSISEDEQTTSGPVTDPITPADGGLIRPPLTLTTDSNTDSSFVLGRPDIGAIFRTILQPPLGAAGADGGQAVPTSDGTVVFACGPAGMVQEVQVRNFSVLQAPIFCHPVI